MNDPAQKKSITENDVKYVARLSRLSLGDDETHRFREQLSSILEYIAQLNEVDTENTPPTTHVLSSMKNVFREDELKGSIPVEEAVSNAPSKKANFFTVPKIIKDN